MIDPIDIKDQCLSIIIDELDPGRPYNFQWLGHDLYLFLNKEESDDTQIINIYITEE
jgi:hypothetical protein